LLGPGPFLPRNLARKSRQKGPGETLALRAVLIPVKALIVPGQEIFHQGKQPCTRQVVSERREAGSQPPPSQLRCLRQWLTMRLAVSATTAACVSARSSLRLRPLSPFASSS
jgi:hypothetical protein